MAFIGAAMTASAFGWAGSFFADGERLDVLVMPVLIMYAAAELWTWFTRDRPPADTWIDAPRPRWIVAMLALVAPLLVTTQLSGSSLLHASRSEVATTSDMFRSSLPRLDDGQYCPPPDALIRFARAAIPVDSVFAVDFREQYQPSLFMPQQLVVWPRGEGSGAEILFPRYFEHYNRSSTTYDQQPLFNDRETREERLAFIRDLRVTHILVNPVRYQVMSEVLARDPDTFKARYDDGQWALYEVVTIDGSS